MIPGVFSPLEAVREVVFELVRRTGLREAYVQLVDTRGMPPIGSRDPRQCVNRFQAFCIPYVWIATREKQRTGLAMHVSERWRVPAQSGWILFRRRLICELARQGRVTVISKHMWCYCMACRRSRIDMWYCFLVRPSLSSRDGRVRMRIRLHQETSRPLALIGKLVIECSLYPDQACPRPSRG